MRWQFFSEEQNSKPSFDGTEGLVDYLDICSNPHCHIRAKRTMDQSRCSAIRSFGDTFKKSTGIGALPVTVR